MGLIYDKDENQRMIGLLKYHEDELNKLEASEDKTKDVVRFAFVGIGAVAIVLIASIVFSKKTKK